MGKPGSFKDADVIAAIQQYEEVAKRYDKWIGFHVVATDHKQIAEKVEKGYNFIAFSFDAHFLGQIIRTELSYLKKYNK
jgi:2-keto-3-deoxy-L-rhamnonate aldolase RhmA